jgi:hypothetical protein
MGARPKTRQVHRERKAPTPQPPRGAKQIVIPMTRPQYDDLWHQAGRERPDMGQMGHFQVDSSERQAELS